MKLASSPDAEGRPLLKWGLALVLFAVTVAIYAPVRHHGFLPLDDADYVTDNPHVLRGLTAEGLEWAFTRFHSANWHPLTWLSHMLDCELFGPNPGPSHIVNVVLHAASGVLLLLLLVRMTGALWRSALVAALFAWHPLHVQSVAWIAERKDVLSGLFWMLTILAYVGWVRQPGRFRFGVVVLCYALGLMAKPMLVSLPIVLLLLDYWPLGRASTTAKTFRLRELVPLISEKVPLIVLAGASCVVTVLAQRSGGAVVPVDHLPLLARTTNAAISYGAYLWKALWPARLSITYPYDHDPADWQWGLAVVVLAGITVAAVRFARRAPFLAVGWSWYLVTLVPVIGIVQVGGQAMADRYTYLPLTGIFIAAVWGSSLLLSRLAYGRFVGAIGGSAIAGLLIVGTARELRYWGSNEALFTRAIEVTGGGVGSRACLGMELVKQGRVEEAIKQFEEALRLAPNKSGAHYDLANALMSQSRYDEALEHFETALRLNPRDPRVHNNLGSALLKKGRFDEALARYQESVRLNPDQAEAQFNLAGCLAQKGQRDEAIAHYERAVYLRPEHAEAQNNLGSMRLSQGKVNEAVEHLSAALRAKPEYVNAHINLANALVAAGRSGEAVSHFQEALRLKPDVVPALRDLAWMRASSPRPEFRNGLEAIALAERAATLTRQEDPSVLDALAAAYAEAGRFSEAVAAAVKARDVALALKRTQLAVKIDARIQLYNTGTPYRRND